MAGAAAADLRNLAHFIYISLLLLKLGEGRLDGGDGCVVVGDRAHGREPTGVVEPGNVDGRGRRGDYHRSWRGAGRARRGGGWGCGQGGGWWRCAWFLLWFGLDLKREMGDNFVPCICNSFNLWSLTCLMWVTAPHTINLHTCSQAAARFWPEYLHEFFFSTPYSFHGKYRN